MRWRRPRERSPRRNRGARRCASCVSTPSVDEGPPKWSVFIRSAMGLRFALAVPRALCSCQPRRNSTPRTSGPGGLHHPALAPRSAPDFRRKKTPRPMRARPDGTRGSLLLPVERAERAERYLGCREWSMVHRMEMPVRAFTHHLPRYALSAGQELKRGLRRGPSGQGSGGAG
jgi:hypothetical protein